MTNRFARVASVFLFTAALAVISSGSVAAQQPAPAQPAPVAKVALKSPAPASDVLAEALKTAAAEKKGVFVHFGASWCAWCHKLEAFLASPEGKLFAESLVVRELIVLENGEKVALENAGGRAMMTKWGGTGGIPFFVFLDAQGTVLSDANGMPNGGNIGYPANPAEVKAFETAMLKGAPNMPADVRTKILEYIAKHP